MVWKPHATVAAVIEDDGKFLLVEENIRGELQLNQPAGHLDPNESLLDAVSREVREEAAWDFTPAHLTGVYIWDQPATDRTFLRFTFCGSYANHDPAQTLDDGIVRTLWLSRDEVAAQTHRLRSPLVLTCIDDYIAGKRYPLEMLSVIGERHL